MAHVTDDCIVETTTTTGTGDITLAGAVVGFKAFSAVCTAPSDTVFYMIEAIDGSGDRTGAWESGFGTYSAANTLTRTAVQKSSNANAAVSFAAGTKRVSISLTSKQFKFRGALVRKASDLTAQNFTAATAIAWDQEAYDTDAFHDNVTNNSRMTIPAGVNYVKLLACLTLAGITADMYGQLIIRKNGSASYDGRASVVIESGLVTPSISVVSPVLAVVAGDYFEVFLLVETDTTVDITAVSSWFAIEAAE